MLLVSHVSRVIGSSSFDSSWLLEAGDIPPQQSARDSIVIACPTEPCCIKYAFCLSLSFYPSILLLSLSPHSSDTARSHSLIGEGMKCHNYFTQPLTGLRGVLSPRLESEQNRSKERFVSEQRNFFPLKIFSLLLSLPAFPAISSLHLFVLYLSYCLFCFLLFLRSQRNKLKSLNFCGNEKYFGSGEGSNSRFDYLFFYFLCPLRLLSYLFLYIRLLT